MVIIIALPPKIFKAVIFAPFCQCTFECASNNRQCVPSWGNLGIIIHGRGVQLNAPTFNFYTITYQNYYPVNVIGIIINWSKSALWKCFGISNQNFLTISPIGDNLIFPSSISPNKHSRLPVQTVTKYAPCCE